MTVNFQGPAVTDRALTGISRKSAVNISCILLPESASKGPGQAGRGSQPRSTVQWGHATSAIRARGKASLAGFPASSNSKLHGGSLLGGGSLSRVQGSGPPATPRPNTGSWALIQGAAGAAAISNAWKGFGIRSHQAAVVGRGGGTGAGVQSQRAAGGGQNPGFQSQGAAADRRVEGVITATRLRGDRLRVMGPGMQDLPALGKLLFCDEFFLDPHSSQALVESSSSNSSSNSSRPAHLATESLVYYLEESSNYDEEEEDQPRHGVQLLFTSDIRLSPGASRPQQHGDSVGPPILEHVREAGAVPLVHMHGSAIGSRMTASSDTMGRGAAGELSIDDQTDSSSRTRREPNEGLHPSASIPMSEGQKDSRDPATIHGGAAVRVVAGALEGVAAAPPFTDFLLWDVDMRPGAAISLPIPAAYGAVAYILEGVGFFGSTTAGSSEGARSYQNEGHALWIPPGNLNDVNSELQVSSHAWSHLRFLLIGAKI